MREDRQSPSRRAALRRVAGIATGTLLAGCLSGEVGTTATESTDTETDPATGTGTMTGTTTPSVDHTVGLYTDLYFDPIGLHVEPGDTVAFELVSGAHSATAYHPDNEAVLERRVPQDAKAWDTGTWSETGTSRTITLEAEGTHDYFCIPHKGVEMVGRIVVGSPGGPATASANPDGKLPASARIVSEGSVPYDEWASE
ncbi:plastocyanin/azurin family copper-binding protein [Haloarchaeobius sp. HME9146]|uniref:plastocyanin/azurin family copper-binding protein n=1 Tax=Haloarchaeobius sp. HME9146 TaxID=2978732 RepID=UPI0021C020EC|nr:plastocyanin/azurin family copper-binding protein [Haloarchaeobius sp. HME9146]MCT9094749.1 plastocyanin/azurin family copper-binding protein [Haloarchaeobius sp. HME9146]